MILVGVPCQDTVKTSFMIDLFRLLRSDANTELVIAESSFLLNARGELANIAVESKASHLLFLDSDMRFPPTIAQRLASHGPPIVGVNYSQRLQSRNTAIDMEGKPLKSRGEGGLREVSSCGFGALLIATSVFHEMRKPWFAFDWDGTQAVGEDVFFCRKVRMAGYQIMIDQTLSNEVRHIGSRELVCG